MFVHVTGDQEQISENEQAAYVDRALEKFGDSLEGIDIELDGEFARIRYHLKTQPFERVRRITGYLVGTMDKWNNAKRAEEHDRVKHPV